MRYIHSQICNNVTVTPGQTQSYDLPINPVSMILLTMRWQQAKTGPYSYNMIDNILSIISKIDVTYRGRTLYSASGQDAVMMSRIISGAEPVVHNATDADSTIRMCTIPIALSPYLYSPDWASPASKRGELQLQITCATPPEEITDATYSAEVVELEAAEPKYYMQCTPHAVLPQATGNVDIDLPIGQDLCGIMLRADKVPDDDNDQCSIRSAALLIDNREEYISYASWAALRTHAQMRAPEMLGNTRHQHAIGTTDQGDWTTETILSTSYTQHYGYIDLIPCGMEDYILHTAGHSRIHLAIDCGDTSQIVAYPILRCALTQ
jgi:hypothetical protein